MNWQGKLRLENAQLRECLRELLEASSALLADVELEFDKRGITKTHSWHVTRHAIAKASGNKKGTV